MRTAAARLEALEESIGKGCPRCAKLPPLVRVECEDDRLTRHHEPQPPRGSGVCPDCGRDRMTIVEIVLVKATAIGGQRL